MTSEVIERLAGNRCILIGFDSGDIDRIVRVLEKARAFSRVLRRTDIEEITLRSHPFDVLILNSILEPNTFPCFRSGTFEKDKPLLLIGSLESLSTWTPVVQELTSDFLFIPWSPEAVAVRLYQLLSAKKQRSGSPPSALRKGPPNVLIADDDMTNNILVKEAIESDRMSCTVATTGREALEMAWSSAPPNAVILDINMPCLNGFEVLASLKKDPRTSSTPVILLTAKQQEVDILYGFRLGADDYIVKPFSPLELMARLKRLLPK